MKLNTKKIVLSGLFLALGIVLPFFTGQIKQIGNMLLPMHIPVMICGFVCGWPYGLAVGFITPLLRSALFGMPVMMPTAVAMAVELAVYGTVAGAMYSFLKERKGGVYISLITAMIAGRVAWGMVSVVLYGAMGNTFSWTLFVAGAFLNAIPGIVVQIILVPIIVLTLNKRKLV